MSFIWLLSPITCHTSANGQVKPSSKVIKFDTKRWVQFTARQGFTERYAGKNLMSHLDFNKSKMCYVYI